MKKFIFVFLMLCLSGCYSEQNQFSNLPQSDDNLPPYVGICIEYHENNLTYTDHGTGFFIEKGNKIYLMTALHNLSNLKRGILYVNKYHIKIADSNSKCYVINNAESDCAAILMEGIKPQTLRIGTISPGDKIFVYGYPKNGDKLISNSGTVLDISIETNAAIERGHSGSPYINSNGEVVGIASHILLENEKVCSKGVLINSLYDKLP